MFAKVNIFSPDNGSQFVYVLNVTSDDLISNQLLHVFIWIFYAALTLFIDVFGTMTNIINIVCFIKQGFKDMVNISLMGKHQIFFLLKLVRQF